MDSKTASLTRQQYWQRTRRLTACLLATWLILTLAAVFFARPLVQVTLFGWPLSFYLAAQGSVLGFMAIVAVYVWRMRKLDQALEQEGSDHAA